LAGRRESSSADQWGASGENFGVSAPSITLRKGGGAIRRVGEKFTPNPVTGTSSMAVPLFASPGRSGFGPQLSLSCDFGAGNCPFGFGWNLSIPSIARSADKGLPKYRDAEASNVVILSGAENLFPILVKYNGRSGHRPSDSPQAIPVYVVQVCRPRIWEAQP